MAAVLASLQGRQRIQVAPHPRQQGQQLRLGGVVAARQHLGRQGLPRGLQRLVQRLALGAQREAQAAPVLGVRLALQPALVLQQAQHARHLGLVGAAVAHQFFLRGAGVAANEVQRAHLVEGQVRVHGGHRAHHARPVGVHQVVQGFKHIGAGAWGHGVAIG